MVYQRVSKPSSGNSQIHKKDSPSTAPAMPVPTQLDSASPQEQEMPSYTPLAADWVTNNNLIKNLSGVGVIQRKSLKEKLQEHPNQVQEIKKRFKDNPNKILKLRDAVAKIANQNPQIVKDLAQDDDGKAALRAMLKSMSSSTSKEAEKFGCLAIQAIFGIQKVEGFGGTALARLYSVLETIPAKHINSLDNTSLQSMVRDKSTWLTRRGLGESTHSPSAKKVTIAYGKAILGHTHGDSDKVLRPLGMPFMSSPQSKLAQANLFDQTVLHEIGHAVDHKLGIMNEFGSQSLFGGWQEHDIAPQNAILEAYENSGLKDTCNDDLIKECVNAIVEGKQIKKIIEEKVDELNSDNSDPQKRINKKQLIALIAKYNANRAIKAARIGGDKFSLQGAQGAWQMSDKALGEVALNGRVFHKAYAIAGSSSKAGNWMSYELAAREHKVSMYQWRSPGEWFAEIYSHYFLNILPKSHPIYDWIKKFIDQNDHLNPDAIKKD